MPSSFQAEIEDYYKAKGPYKELLEQAMVERKPAAEPVSKSDPKPNDDSESKESLAKDNENSQIDTTDILELLSLDGLTINHEAIAKAANAVKGREEKEAKTKAKAKGKR